MQLSSSIQKKRLLRILTAAFVILFFLPIFLFFTLFMVDQRINFTPEIAITSFFIILMIGLGVYLFHRQQTKMLDVVDHFEDLVIEKFTKIKNKEKKN